MLRINAQVLLQFIFQGEVSVFSYLWLVRQDPEGENKKGFAAHDRRNSGNLFDNFYREQAEYSEEAVEDT